MRPAMASAPSEAFDAIEAAFADLPSLRTAGARAGDRVSEPLPLYGVRVEALLDRGEDEIFVRYGWRAILHADTRNRLVDVEQNGDKLVVARIAAGEAVDRLIEAGGTATALAEELGDCEPRVVEAPALKTAALWLAGESSRFIRYSGPGIRIYDEAEFICELRQKAENLRAAYVRGLHQRDSGLEPPPGPDAPPANASFNRRDPR